MLLFSSGIKYTTLAASLALIALLLSPSLALAAGTDAITPGEKGHVAFFFTAGMGAKGAQKAYGDFIYSYEQARRTLESMGYTSSYHSSLPIRINNNGLILALDKSSLSQGAGLVLIRKGGRFSVAYGVYSEASIMKLVKQYFGRR